MTSQYHARMMFNKLALELFRTIEGNLRHGWFSYLLYNWSPDTVKLHVNLDFCHIRMMTSKFVDDGLIKH